MRELRPREVVRSEEYIDWHAKIKDSSVIEAIATRLRRVKDGNFGNSKHVGDKIYELKIYLGPGYRIYFAEINNVIILLTNGGTKHRQQKDITKAKVILARYKEMNV